MKMITDQQLDQALAARLPLFVVVFADRTRRTHQRFLGVIGAVTADCVIHVLDVAENPSVVAARRLGRSLVVDIFVDAVRIGRWRGARRIRDVCAAVNCIVRATDEASDAGE